jgi:hypothetical protein
MTMNYGHDRTTQDRERQGRSRRGTMVGLSRMNENGMYL